MIVHKLYDGKVEMVYNPVEHLYSANGILIPSVTGITGVMDKPALIGWAVKETVGYIKDMWTPGREYTQEQIDSILLDSKKARFRKSEKAKTIGTNAHDWIERWIKARTLGIKPPELPEYPPVLRAVNSYLTWESKNEILYMSSERRVYSMQYMYSGTVDIIMEINGDIVVADLKTSKAIYPEYFIQCAAYANAINEEDGTDIKEISIIRIPKDGKDVEIVFSEDIQYLMGVFRACLAIWRWKNQWSADSDRWRV